MKVKFRSRTIMETAPTPLFFTMNMATYIIPFLILFACVSDGSVKGQRVFLLYSLPNSSPYQDLQQKQLTGANDYINSVRNDIRVNTGKSFMKIVPVPAVTQYYQPKSSPINFQRSRYIPLILPFGPRNYGYGSATNFGHEEQAPFYNNRNIRNFYGDGSSYENEDDAAGQITLFDQNILRLPKRRLMEAGKNSDENVDSGSKETSMEEFSNPSTLMNNDQMNPVIPLVIFDESVDISEKCTQEGPQARFHTETRTCYTIGTKGPCGNNMIFTASDDFNGYCECDQVGVERPLIRIGEQCHFLYTQAMCPQGYWLTLMTSNSDPDCQPNPCYTHSMVNTYLYNPSKKAKSFTKLVTSSKDDLVLFKGQCVQLNSPSKHCRREGEVVIFPEGRTEPACGFPKSTRRIHRRQITSVHSFTCKRGMRRHPVTKNCVRYRTVRFVG